MKNKSSNRILLSASNNILARIPRMHQSKGFYRWGWDVIEGCTNGCSYCYARERSAKLNRDFTKPVFRDYLLDEPFKVPPSMIFVNWLGDIMCASIHDEWILAILDTCKQLPKHDFLFMTKLPHRYNEFNWPANCILGVSVESPLEWWRAEEMMYYKSRKMCSVEPILGDFTGYDFSQFEFVVIGCLIRSDDKRFYHTVKHDKIFYTR